MKKTIKHFSMIFFMTTISTLNDAAQSTSTTQPNPIRNIDYFSTLRNKFSEYTNPFYQWYYKHKDTIDTMAKSSVVLGLAMWYTDYVVHEHYQNRVKLPQEAGLSRRLSIEELLRRDTK